MRTGITIKQPDGNLYQPEKEYNAMAIQATNPTPTIKLGDHVRFSSNGEYFGVVKAIIVKSFIHVTTSDGRHDVAEEEMLEVATRLTSDEAWAELPYLILEQIHQRTVWGAVRIHEFDQKQIRHECYKLLGGAGVKIDEQVKARVRKAIARTAREFNVELA